MASEARGGSRLKSGVERWASAWSGSLALGLVGLSASVYLTWLKTAGAYGSCIGVGDCELVNQSTYSELGGIPIALFGALTYLGLNALLLWERRTGGDWPLLTVFGLTTFGTLYSGYLTFIELFVLRAICPYCVVSAVAMTGFWGLTIYRLLGSDFLAGD